MGTVNSWCSVNVCRMSDLVVGEVRLLMLALLIWLDV
jgi:hypothetical protein